MPWRRVISGKRVGPDEEHGGTEDVPVRLKLDCGCKPIASVRYLREPGQRRKLLLPGEYPCPLHGDQDYVPATRESDRVTLWAATVLFVIGIVLLFFLVYPCGGQA